MVSLLRIIQPFLYIKYMDSIYPAQNLEHKNTFLVQIIASIHVPCHLTVSDHFPPCPTYHPVNSEASLSLCDASIFFASSHRKAMTLGASLVYLITAATKVL